MSCAERRGIALIFWAFSLLCCCFRKRDTSRKCFSLLIPALALSRRVSQGCVVHGATVSVSSSLRQEVYARRTPACATATPSSSAQDVKIILGRVKRDYRAARRIVFFWGRFYLVTRPYASASDRDARLILSACGPPDATHRALSS